MKETALNLLAKYGSRSDVYQNRDKLVRLFGRERFDALMMEMGMLEDSGEDITPIIREIRIKHRLPVELTQQEIQEKKKKDDANRKAFERNQFFKSHFLIDAEYVFIVTDRWFSDNQQRVVVDEYGNEHPANLTSRYRGGDKVVCRVLGYNSSTVDNGNNAAYLKLSQPRSIEIIPEGAPRHFVVSPEAWNREVDGLGKHKCGKPFTCSCCGRYFPANHGFRVDGKDIYFCNYCKKLVYMRSGRGWSGVVISTPMGNKR